MYMQERLSVAEGCMGERERELRAQVEKLQQANMDLTRDLNVNANVHSSASHAIHTSERMAAGLSWQHGDEVAHLREVIKKNDSSSHIYIRTYTCIHTYIYVYIQCSYIQTYIHTYSAQAYIYTHTYIHTYSVHT